jgi:hypothetical protein
LEDYGVFWQVTVQDADTIGSIAVAPPPPGTPR